MPRRHKPDITFHYLGVQFTFRDRNKLRSLLIALFKNENRELSALTYIFCDDTYLLQLNQQFLGHDFYTDILTFDQSEKKGMVAGEIYISIPQVYENASLHGETFKNELHRVIFHGALHLCSYQDKTANEVKEMRARENFYLKLYFHGFT